MIKKWCFCVILIPFLLLSGCADPKILEEVGLITTIGYDVGKDGTYKGTGVELKIEPNAKTDIMIVEAEAHTVRGLNINANKNTSKRLLSGQLRVILMGEELASKGIIHIVESLSRDPSISDLAYVAIVEGETRDLLNLKSEQIPDIGLHLFRMIEKDTKGELMPSATMQEVIHDYYSLGVDPIIPILKKNGNKGVQYTGTGIFKDDKMVGKISTNQSFYFKLINDKYKSGSIEMTINSDSLKLKRQHPTVIVLDTIHSDSDIKLVSKKNLEYELKIKLNGRLLETNPNIDFSKKEHIELIEKEVSKQMKKEVEKLISYLQSKNSDVIGLGQIYRSSVRHSKLTNDEWHNMFKDVKVQVKIDFNIIRTGVID
ncbi:Ger(x)C family spore germination protein [Pseudoneobacillus sp. C159]